MKRFGQLLLILLMLTAFADLFFASTFNSSALNQEISALDSAQSVDVVTAPCAETDHHHDGPCEGGHCHLGHCAFLISFAPVVRLFALPETFANTDRQSPSSPALGTLKRPPRA